MERILVTGAAGFIGNKIMQELMSDDCEVFGWDCIAKDNVSVVDLSDIEAFEIMTPRVDIIGLEVNTPIKEIKNNFNVISLNLNKELDFFKQKEIVKKDEILPTSILYSLLKKNLFY